MASKKTGSKAEETNTDIVDPHVDRQEDREGSSKVADKEMTALNLAEMIGLNAGAKTWVSKSFKNTDIRKAIVWAGVFIDNGVIHELPSILK